MKFAVSLLLPLLIIACRHPLAIVGEGDIVDLNGGSFGCTLEEFSAGAMNCIDNDVSGDYYVNYAGVPREGWEFSHWDGSCGHLSEALNCRFDVTELFVDYWDENFSEVVAPTLTAVFVQAEPGALVVLDDGVINAIWDRGINAFDAAIGFGECGNDGGAGCPSIGWEFVDDQERGDVLEVSHSASGDFAGLFISLNGVLNLSAYSDGDLEFDIKVMTGDSHITMKLDCNYPCTSGDQALGSRGSSGWESVKVNMATLAGGGLDLANVSTGLVIWASNATSTVFRLDNVRFTGIADGESPPTRTGSTGNAEITAYGAGSISDLINPDSYRCVFDFGNWIYNAGVVEPGIAGCNTATGIPVGNPTPLYPQLTGPAEREPTATHKWWGSLSFLGEMTIGDSNDAAYITPDPITARISERGVRVLGIPAGLISASENFFYPIPDPFAEVFDGIAVGNSLHHAMEGYMYDHSDGSVTVEWQSGGNPVMQATFIHGSVYVYFKVFDGDLEIRTLRADGGEKGTFYSEDNSLGIWTSVAGNHNNFLITGEGATTFSNVSSEVITVSNSAGEYTLALLPHYGGHPPNAMSTFFAAKSRNVVASVDIDYSVDRSTSEITVSHRYLDDEGELVTTIAGLQPLHWKRSSQAVSAYQVRSARGMIKFAQTSNFSYTMPSVGVLPSLPTIAGTFDQAVLEGLVNEFMNLGEAGWNDRIDAYWAGKNYGKVAELIAIAEAIGMTAEATTLRDWLKSELADWFTATTGGDLDINKYFVYDEDWNTLLAMEESFSSHQQLNDHHFHYGYLVRAAAEICRAEPAWCGDTQYGPVIELLIRDYAAGRDDPMFPYLRHFDPANGFSWASGRVNFARGNNNESTSEAATAYGAIILYGLVMEDEALVERGMYLHASTSAAYWEYWNNIDGYNNRGGDADNFPPDYNFITTSIVWGDGAVFSTWFSAAYAHILGIQGLPSNPLILHVGLYEDYLADYIALGLSESSNGMPSGLSPDQWTDLWWNLLALSDADVAIADYLATPGYDPEAGETRAHTYHWLYTFARLGQLKTGTGALTANYPAAMAFDNNGVMTYVVYNFADTEIDVIFSDGEVVKATPGTFTLVTR